MEQKLNEIIERLGRIERVLGLEEPIQCELLYRYPLTGTADSNIPVFPTQPITTR